MKQLSSKSLLVRPIKAKLAHAFVRKHHYSHSSCQNSQLHLGVFWNGLMRGCLQYGPSMYKPYLIKLVRGTKWDECLELNRMVMTDEMPRNSESRAIAVSLRMLKKKAPHVKWVMSYADGCQCGDGTIYRATGFVLTGIIKNSKLRADPVTGKPMHDITAWMSGRLREFRGTWKVLDGYQLRYIYFLDPSWRSRLTVPEIPYSRIKEMGASMYKGRRCVRSDTSDTPATHAGEGGAEPTLTLQTAGG